MSNKILSIHEILEYKIKVNGEAVSFEQYINSQYTQGKNVGVQDGINIAIKFIEEDASRLFLQNKDAQAIMLRNLIEKLRESLKEVKAKKL